MSPMFARYFPQYEQTTFRHEGFQCSLARVPRGFGFRPKRGFGFTIDSERPPTLLVLHASLRVKRLVETTQTEELFDVIGHVGAPVRLTVNLERTARRTESEWWDHLGREMEASEKYFLEEPRTPRLVQSYVRSSEMWPHGPVRLWSSDTLHFVDAWVAIADARLEMMASFPWKYDRSTTAASWLRDLTVIRE